MATVKNLPDFQVDGRVSIALDALDDEQKRAVGTIITDRARFLETASDARKVQRISRESPVYALKAPAGLRIIYSRIGDDIVVMDLMRQATLDQFRRKKPKAKGPRKKPATNAPDVGKAK